GIHLAPKEKLNIPVLFMPDAMKMCKAEVVVHVMRENAENWTFQLSAESNKDLSRNLSLAENGGIQGILWKYPVHGIPEAPQQKLVVIRCPARQSVEQKLEMLLIGVVPDATAATDGRNPAMANTDNSANIQKVQVTDVCRCCCDCNEMISWRGRCTWLFVSHFCQLQSVPAEALQEYNDTETALSIDYEKLKSCKRFKLTVVIQWVAGGVWKFPLLFIATEPGVDDVIDIEAVGLNKESVVGFTLTSQTR
ncbi:CFA47 protein, partial [Furnarius figulus]|nr:CFA47 protein [Furnarius figulus]